MSNNIYLIFREFESFLKDEFSHNTASGYALNVKNFIEYYYENSIKNLQGVDYKTVDNEVITKWFYKLLGNGYSANSIRRYKNSLMKFFQFISEVYLIPVPKVDQIVIPQGEIVSSIVDAIRHEEIKEIAEHALSIRDKVIILFIYETGMRRQELIDCKVSHVDFENNRVNIYNGDKLDRIGYFSDITKKYLLQYQDEWSMEIDDINAKRYMRSLERNEFYTELKRSEYLFQTIKSPQMSYATVFKALKDASFEYYINKAIKDGFAESEAKKVAEEQTNKVNTEVLRQSRRTYLFSQGLSVEKVQVIMGDENWHVCKKYLKVAQQLYPEKFGMV